MSVDQLSNMLSAIKNASMVGKSNFEFVYSKECESVAKLLVKRGYLKGVRSFKPKGKKYKMLSFDLAYDKGDPNITDIKRVSRPGRRIYSKSNNVGKLLGGYGLMVISTSRGVMSGEEARKKKLGGEVVCEIW